MPDQNAPEIVMAGGATSSSQIPAASLIPTEALIRLAKRFELGVERKGDKAWNALSSNQAVLVDREFIMHRISHVILHAMKLRDKLVSGVAIDEEDDAGAISWGGAFLCCATKQLGELGALEAAKQRLLENQQQNS
jgi:hypothetical protein